MADQAIDASKATSIVRKYLEDNFGNIQMLLFNIESVEQNGTKDRYKVMCSLLPSLGSSKRIYYFIKVDISTGALVDIFKGTEENGKVVFSKSPAESA